MLFSHPNPTNLAQLWQGRRRFLRALYTLLVILVDYKLTAIKASALKKTTQDNTNLIHLAHKRNSKRLYQLFQKNGGTWIKAGQFLSAKPDILPMEYVATLAPLQNDVTPLGFHQIEPILAEHLGTLWREKFAHFDENPIASASISQVYKAQLMDGDWVALKIMRPDIISLWRQDFNLYRTLSKLVSNRLSKVDITTTMEVFLDALDRELNFIQEAENITAFSKLNHIAGIRSPHLVSELSNNNIITTQWIDGTPIVDFLKPCDSAKQAEILGRLQHSYIQQIIRFGMFQGDAHPGNFLVDEEENIVIFDFGYVGILSEQERLNYAKLLLSLVDNNIELFKEALHEGGFERLPDQQFFEKLIKAIVATSTERVYKLKYKDLEALAIDLLQELKRMQLEIPKHYLVTGRVLITISGLFKLFKLNPKPIDIKKVLFES